MGNCCGPSALPITPASCEFWGSFPDSWALYSRRIGDLYALAATVIAVRQAVATTAHGGRLASV